jgi:uncharacterized membrane-anchored protein
MLRNPRPWFGPLALLLLLALAGRGQAQIEQIQWTEGPAKVSLGSNATLDLPKGYRFADAAGARKFMEATHNLYGGQLGVLIPPENEEDVWFVLFDFQDIGYVKDTDTLDDKTADSILSQIRANTDKANQERRSRGWETMQITGWSQKPFYDSVTHGLTWAILASSGGEEVVNYDARVLGRRGIMRVQMVLDPKIVPQTMPKFQGVVKAVAFNSGDTYAEFRSGDKIAQYGLVGLMTGGAAVVAVKFWKPLIAFGAVILGVIGKFFRKVKGAVTGNKAPS